MKTRRAEDLIQEATLSWNGSQPDRGSQTVQMPGCESGQVTARLRLALSVGMSRAAPPSSVQMEVYIFVLWRASIRARADMRVGGREASVGGRNNCSESGSARLRCCQIALSARTTTRNPCAAPPNFFVTAPRSSTACSAPTTPMAPSVSPFLDAGTSSSAHSLGILQLKRDHLIPTVLSDALSTEYAEGNVVNTRFGSFPHSSLIDKPWGTQVLASVVDTGSRGGRSKKRKREANGEGNAVEDAVGGEEPVRGAVRAATTASSGFAHLVPPTPETWTLCLPHRTQVVYTPDYSFIIQKTRLRPGDHIIEAGAGSGSFTHAVARTVFNGYPGLERPEEKDEQETDGTTPSKRKRRQKRDGHVYSFEYHKPRAEQLRKELVSHGLDPLVTVTNRDVYADGFCLEDDDTAPNADVIFLDLPAPWLALKHLTRSPPPPALVKSIASDPSTPAAEFSTSAPQPPKPFRSPLNPKTTTRICTFSPCIEQVQKTVAAMRSYGWLDIEMFTLEHKRLEVRRERIGLAEEGLRGANPSPATVQEAVQRLRDVEDRAKAFHGLQKEKQVQVMRRAEAKKRGESAAAAAAGEEDVDEKKMKIEGLPPSKHDRLERAKKDSESRALFREGRLVCRTEPEIKTHTSYLVFAMLPVEWTAEDEEKATRKWG
jgi:tRNA (adenine57-N1/adenine58-N1)-methyltransferase